MLFFYSCSKFPSGTIFLLSETFPLEFFLELVFWQQILLVLLHLRMSLVHLHFWAVFLLNIEFWFGSSFQHLKMCVTSFCPLWFLMRNLYSFKLLFLYRKCIIYLWSLSKNFFCFIFVAFWLWCVWTRIYLSLYCLLFT